MEINMSKVSYDGEKAVFPGRLQRNFCLLGLFIAWIVGYADRVAISTAVIPIGHEFNLDAAQIGYVLSAFYLSYSLVQPIGGWLADRFGSRMVLIACVLSWSVFTFLTGYAWSFISLILIRFFFGFGEGSFSPASTVTIAEYFPKNERARAKSLILSTVFLGSAVGSGFIAAAVTNMGWRYPFHILGVVGIFATLLLWVCVKPQPKKSSQVLNTLKKDQNMMSIIKRPDVLKVTLIWMGASVIFVGLQSWMPSYLFKVRGIDILHIGVASIIPYVVGFLGTNAVGWLLDKIGAGHEKACMMVGAILCAIFLMLLINTTSLPIIVILWSLSLLAFNLLFATVFVVPLKYFPNAIIGSATGVMQMGGQLAAAVTPTVMGLLITSTGSYFTAFWFPVFAVSISFIVALFWKVSPQPKAENS